MPSELLESFTVIIGISAAVIWLYSAYHWIGMLTNVHPDKRLFVYLIPVGLFIGLFSESYFTEKGNYHRVRSLIGFSFFVGLCLLGGLSWHFGTKMGG
jgi:hypothetical protein